METTQTNSFLETEKLGTLMRRYSLPCIISLLVGALYNIVDQIFIANADYLGSYGNAANTVVFPLTVIALSIATMIGDGCCAFVSISLGAREQDNAHRGVGSSVVLTVLAGVVLAAVYLAFRTPILTAFGATVNAETFALSQEYFFWIALGVPFYMFGQAMNPIIRSDGSPKFAMMSLLGGAVCNIILDPIFIFVFRWGMMGAAVATVAGQVLSAVLAVAYLFHMKAVTLRADSFRPRWRLLRRILPLGATSFLSQISIVFSMAAVLNMCRKYGAVDPIFGQAQYAQIPTAVVGIVMKFFQIVISVAVGLSAGCIPVVGYNIGAGRKDRARALMWRLLFAEAAVGLVATVLFECFPQPLVNIFGAKNESVYYTEFAIRCIRLFLCATTLSCVNKGTFIYLQALGKAGPSTALSLLREIVFGVGLVVLLPVWFGLDGVLYFMAVADVLTFAAAAVVIVKTDRELRAPAPEDASAAVPPAVTRRAGVVVAVGRSYGAGGRTAAKLLAERLEVPYYDAELLSAAAERLGLSQKYLADIDEKSLPSGAIYRFDDFESRGFASIAQTAYQAQAEIIERVAEEGSCVIVGRRADQILKGRKELFSVFFTASEDARAKRVAQRESLSLDAARKKLAKVDRERARYYDQLSDRPWGEAGTYDLCIDTEKLGLEGAVELIAAALTQMDAAQGRER